LREPADSTAGHDTATLKAFQIRRAKSAAVGLACQTIGRIVSCRFPAISLRLNAKRGIVTALDADDWVRIRD
jgi:hypothetical protein